ncbi:hypothetical protein [Methylophaga sp.]|uniref:hypothetical protein n=1 Tax=Methylophaga sp. TaxID=2024840 RepID=UPI002725ABA1|nr:hypothetical protein [Methylophaga sp.]MDO8826362.1 hypothetical protein [Methylophaga sp.]
MSKIPVGEIHVDSEGNLVMSEETFKELTNYIEEEDIDDKMEAERKGRKNYCCHNSEDGRCKVIRASNSASAAIKCMTHYAGRPVNSHKGSCNH